MSLTPEESIRALVRLGVPRARAEATVEKLGGNLDRLKWRFTCGDDPALFPERDEKVARSKVAFAAHVEEHRNAIAREVDFAFGVKRLRLPWTALLPDNRKYGVIKGKIILTREYREAKRKAREIAIEQVGEQPFSGAVRFEARVWTPNNSRKRDVVNFSKLVNDALKGVAYVDDSQIDDNRWVRVGADIDAPRCEITVTLIPPES